MRTTVLLVGLTAILAMVLFTGFAVNSAEEPGEKKKVRAGWLGVSVQDVNDEIREERNLPSGDGAYIQEVIDDSPADSIGLKKGDIIVEFGGRKIYDADDLAKSVRRTEPGTRVPVVVLRGGERKTYQVAVGRYPRRSPAHAFVTPGVALRRFHASGTLGMSVMTLNEQLAKYFGAPNNEGVLVESVEEESAAARAGIMAGDVILRVGTRTVDDVQDIWRGLEKFEEGDKAEIEVLRKGSKKVVTVEIDESIEGSWGFGIPHIRSIPPVPGNFRFEYDVAPELEKIERRLQDMKPRMERKIREAVRSVTRSVTI